MRNSSFGYHVGDLYKNNQPKLSFMQRLKGYAYTSKQNASKSLYFEKCRSIHTFGMRFNIEVLFLDKQNKIIAIKLVKPRRLIFAPKGTYSIVELALR